MLKPFSPHLPKHSLFRAIISVAESRRRVSDPSGYLQCVENEKSVDGKRGRRAEKQDAKEHEVGGRGKLEKKSV